MIDFIIKEFGLQKTIAAKIIMRICSLAAAFACAHVSGHYGITVDQAQLTVALFAGIELVRERLAAASPKLAWLAPALLLAALLQPRPAAAADVWTGRLDLSYTDFSAVFARDYTDGRFMAGIEKPMWQLQHNAKEVLYVAPQWLHDINVNSADQSAAAVVGIPLSDGAQALIGATHKLFSSSGVSLPSWTQTATQAVTIEAGGGYNILAHRGFGTVAAVIKVPVG